MQISPKALARQVGDEILILDLASGVYYGLDPVGSRFWELVSAGSSQDDACRTLLQEFDVAEEQLRGDIAALVQSLRDSGLLTDA